MINIQNLHIGLKYYIQMTIFSLAIYFILVIQMINILK